MRVNDVAWFDWWQVQEALAHARAGGIALHYFRYDLRRFGLSANEPACHILSADRAALIAFGSAFDLRAEWLELPRRHRPEVWHFDAFGSLLERLRAAYPLPEAIVRAEGQARLAGTGAERRPRAAGKPRPDDSSAS